MTAHRKFRQLLRALIALLCSVPLYSSFAAAPAKTVTHYRVSTKGLPIGDVTTTQRISDEGGSNRIQFETRTAVKASFLWMGYQLSSTEKGLLQNGALVSYSHKGQENDTTVDVEGRLENTAFRFDVRERGATRSIVIPRASYDYTTMECPEARLDFTQTPRISLRILDVEKMAVVKRNYQLVRNGHYAVAGKEYPCRIVDFWDQNKKARRWIAWDGTTVLMYRQDGRGDKSSYSVQATSLTRGW